MTSLYHEGSRKLQDQFDTRRMADRLDQAIVHDVITPHDRAFIERMDMFFIATVDPEGHANCSYQGRRSGIRTRDRRAHDRLPEFRRQRHVPVDG
jgi:predicted pyridoxine 5'-phosphate oxidase superfamily flavin-nucleotide-binding protein